MNPRTTEIAVLRALLRLSRARSTKTEVTLADLIASVRDDERAVQQALASLARAQLVHRRGEATSLSLAGLAVAVAAAANAKDAVRESRRLVAGRPNAPVIAIARGARRHHAA